VDLPGVPGERRSAGDGGARTPLPRLREKFRRDVRVDIDQDPAIGLYLHIQFQFLRPWRKSLASALLERVNEVGFQFSLCCRPRTLLLEHDLNLRVRAVAKRSLSGWGSQRLCPHQRRSCNNRCRQHTMTA